ncbi:hypothetical protein FUAX_00730 [Fulvitalea axinellae]|uniref:Carrier domain-containing protein n=1 Tax=Fulvitalea axinellae TaxID=1182444 RepID=A0AAU9C6I9_9BACT|nr:hypothetical protein FUAX_00730 [Fulvitalea axinellae]
MNSYYNRIKAFLVSLGVEEKLITPQADIINDLGLSSVDIVDLIFSIESAYDIKIPENSIGQMRTVGALIEHIKINVSPFLMEH